MDRFTFIDHMVGHLLWPIVVLLVVLLFRRPLQERMPNLTKFRAGPGGVEAEFGQVLQRSDQAMAAEPMPAPTDEIAEDRNRLERIAAISPRAAVLEAFTLVDSALKERLREVGVTGADLQMRSTQAIIMAENLGLLGETEVTVWNNLRALSNTARQQPELEIGREPASEYIRLSSGLRSAIEKAVPKRVPQEPVGGGPDPAT
jgi:hypothetical protein